MEHLIYLNWYKKRKSNNNFVTFMYADCYVFTNKRTYDTIENFLNRFIPDRVESADEYEVGSSLKHNDRTVKNVNEAIEYFVNNKDADYPVYWRNNSDEELQGAMCFFTKDGNLILGLYCLTNYPDTHIETSFLAEMKNHLLSDLGYIDYENPPADNKEEFLEKMKL